MREIINFYFRKFPLLAKLAVGILAANYLVGAILWSNNTMLMVLNIVMALIFIPFAIIATGLIKYRGLSIKLIELANFDFNQDTIPEDFRMGLETGKTIDEHMIEKAKKTSGALIRPAVVARSVAVDNDLQAKEYLYTLFKAGVMMGGNKRASVDDEKIERIKTQLDEAKKKITSRPLQKPDSNDKYGFL